MSQTPAFISPHTGLHPYSRARARLTQALRHALTPLFCLLLLSCLPRPPLALLDPWNYTDLRQLDAAEASLPSQDLLAIYTRTAGDELQIRLDWLDHAPLPDYDLYLALDTHPGGTRRLPIAAQAGLEWDTLLVIPAAGPLQALTPEFALRPSTALVVLRDSELDTLSLSLSRAALEPSVPPQGPRPAIGLQAFITPAGLPATLADQTSVARTDGRPPGRAPVLLAFWDTYPAYTPALALRRWDGAHTGPFGGRHGLYNLLRTANASHIPLALLDLKAPASLSALDYQGGLGLVQEMQQAGLLILPEYLPLTGLTSDPLLGWYTQRLVQTNHQASAAFGLPGSTLAYLPNGLAPVPGATRLVFARLPLPERQGVFNPVPLVRWRAQGLLPVFPPSTSQATLEGPTLELRRALVAAALDRKPSAAPAAPPWIVLGGSLPASEWGEPQAARATFRYLASRPWIYPLSDSDLLSAMPSATGWPGGLSQDSAAGYGGTALLEALRRSPVNELGTAAWQAYQAFHTPLFPAPQALDELRAVYLGQVWSLLAAASWAEADASAPQATCQADPDHDGQPECILSNPNLYAQFEIQDGALVYLFSHDATGVHQIVAPSSQFIVGLGEANTWSLANGLAADPGVIPGAFAEPGLSYQASPEGNCLVFSTPDGQRQKIYTLSDNGLRLEYRAPASAQVNLRLPLALDPWERFTPGWAGHYQFSAAPPAWRWSLSGGPGVEVHTNAALAESDFNASSPFMSLPENPDRDYPAGHFLPMPLALVNFNALGSFQIELLLISP
ncbi:MAG: hypothetical protein AB1894_09510 [Chloroflexota bacterium]